MNINDILQYGHASISKTSDHEVVSAPCSAVLYENAVGFPLPNQLITNESTEKVEGAAVRKKGGKTGPKIAAFGRTEKQVQEYIDHEASRTEKLDEEEELKQQRRADKAARDAKKDQEEQERLAEEQKELDEIQAIKDKQAANEQDSAPIVLKKPWNPKKD